MLHAAIAHAQVFGGKLAALDSSRVEAMPGVRKVVRIPIGVAVVADSYWQAKQARDALALRWDDGPFASVSSADLWRDYAALASTNGAVFQRRGEVRIDQAKQRFDGEMRRLGNITALFGVVDRCCCRIRTPSAGTFVVKSSQVRITPCRVSGQPRVPVYVQSKGLSDRITGSLRRARARP